MGAPKRSQPESVLEMKRDCSTFIVKPGESSIFAKDNAFLPRKSGIGVAMSVINKPAPGAIVINKKKNKAYMERLAAVEQK